MNNSDVKKKGFGASLGKYFKQRAIPLIVLIVIIFIAASLKEVFLSIANIENLLVQVTVNMIVSMGALCVILTGGIDLSVGSIVGVCGVLVAGFIVYMNFWLAILITLVIGIMLGMVNGLLVAKFRVAPFVATLGMLSFARGLAYWYTNATPVILSMYEDTQSLKVFYDLGAGRLFNVIPIPALIWITICVLTFFILQYTKIGRIFYSIGGNEEAVKLSGIRADRYKVFAYVLTGFFSALAGILLTSRLRVGAPLSGEGQELDSIAAVVIGGASLSGGIGTVSGTIIGALVLAIIANILNLLNVSAYPQMMLKGVIIVGAVIASTRKKRGKKTSSAKQ